jgi:DNA-binding response OmpR family regulator/AraC-like DNA-binding protein
MIGPRSAPKVAVLLPRPAIPPPAIGSSRRQDRANSEPQVIAPSSTDLTDRRRLLWIEDQPQFVAAVAAYLGAKGLDVEFAMTGEAGFCMANSAAYDLILLDLKLTDCNGIDLLRRIRSAGVRTPVIVITGYGSMESALEAGRAGADSFKSKPLRAADLVLTIRSVIDSSKLEEPVGLFRESRGDSPSDSVRRILAHLTAVMSKPAAFGTNGWPKAQNDLRNELARVAADPSLTLLEFDAIIEALRSISSTQVHWARLALQHQFKRLDTVSHHDWARVTNTVQRFVVALVAAGTAGLHLNEENALRALGVDRDLLSTLLRRDLGLSVLQLRRLIVMRRALQMLAASDEQVAQIAYAVGYEHPSGFNHSFGTYLGLSPKEYRKLLTPRIIDDL